MSRQDLLPILAVLQAVWPTWKLRPHEVDIWCGVLADQDPGALRAAAVVYCRTGKWPPKPSDLIELAAGSPGLDADQAWGEVLAAIRDVGYMGAPEWSDPRVEEALQCFGGWRSLCQGLAAQGTSAHAADRKRFFDAYGACRGRAAARKEREFVQDALAGTLERAGLLPEMGA